MRDDKSIDFSRTARREYLNWFALAAGLVFTALSFSIAPGDNCDSRGQCYPIFVWLGRLLGGALALGFATLLLKNPSRGIRLEPTTGDLIWWNSSKDNTLMGTGRIHPSRIARLEIEQGMDDTNVRLVAQDGTRVPGFSENVLPSPYEAWGKRLVSLWPHIELRIIK